MTRGDQTATPLGETRGGPTPAENPPCVRYADIGRQQALRLGVCVVCAFVVAQATDLAGSACDAHAKGLAALGVGRDVRFGRTGPFGSECWTGRLW